jgi:ribosomal protein S18 acetylase RimI-like enzyme
MDLKVGQYRCLEMTQKAINFKFHINWRQTIMIKIKALTKADNLGDLINLSRQFFAEYQSHDVDFFDIENLHDEHIIAFFEKTIQNNNGSTFIAVSDEKIIGYITVFIQFQAPFYRIKSFGSISGLMVLKEYRNKGIARQLFKKAVEYFEAKQVKHYKLFTSVNNANAIKLYESIGMKPFQAIMIGRIK